jgi:TRAP-type C4-dicarboxylate transport system permease large subunit
VLAIFLIVLGGIYGGVFTATEAAAIGVLLTAVAGAMRRELTWGGLRAALLATAETSAPFSSSSSAPMLNGALALSQMPARAAAFVSTLPLPPLAILALVLIFYIVLGGVMDELSMLVLTLPVVFPAVMQLELFGLPTEAKAIWFGVLLLTVVNIGLIAPPIGLNVYVVGALARDVPIARTYRHVGAFLAADAVRLTVLLLVPALTLWLVQYVR